MFTTLTRLTGAALLAIVAVPAAAQDTAPPLATAPAKGVLRIKSHYSFDETVMRIKADIAREGHSLLRRNRPVATGCWCQDRPAAVEAADLW